MICLDRFEQGRVDPQDMPPLCHCHRCGDEVYNGHYAALGVCEDCDMEIDKEVDFESED